MCNLAWSLSNKGLTLKKKSKLIITELKPWACNFLHSSILWGSWVPPLIQAKCCEHVGCKTTVSVYLCTGCFLTLWKDNFNTNLQTIIVPCICMRYSANSKRFSLCSLNQTGPTIKQKEVASLESRLSASRKDNKVLLIEFVVLVSLQEWGEGNVLPHASRMTCLPLGSAHISYSIFEMHHLPH